MKEAVEAEEGAKDKWDFFLKYLSDFRQVLLGRIENIIFRIYHNKVNTYTLSDNSSTQGSHKEHTSSHP